MNLKKQPPTLCFVGPHFGRHPGWVVSQGEILAGLFRGEGWNVLETSSIRNPWLRLFDMSRTLIWNCQKIDIVILATFSGDAFKFTEAIGKLCRLLDLPLVVVLHGGALPELFAKAPNRAKNALRRAQKLIAPSAYLADAVCEIGLDAEIVPNVFDFSAMRKIEIKSFIKEEPHLLWMRTFHEVYHPELAIEALAILKNQGIRARLTMAGQDKGLEQACRQKAAALGLEDAVSFAGFLDAPGKIQAFAEHDLFLNTNRIDNSPVTVLEAAAAGLPIVATAAGGLPKLLEHEVAALLSPVEDAAALAASIVRLIEDSELRQRLAKEGRQVAEKSSWPAVYAKWQTIFESMA